MAAIIRQAEKRDLESLCHLVHAFHEFHVAGLSLRLASLGDLNVFDSTELTERLTQIFEDSEAAVFVAELDGQLVGFVEIYLRQDDPNPVVVSYKYGYLQSLMVSQNHRSDGYGKQLVHAAEHWAKAKGAEEIRLETWEFLAGPLKFYEKSGYRTLKRTLVKDI
jgi:GNAT superfamily N-acetyltransferase